jgi:hypothetical protein
MEKERSTETDAAPAIIPYATPIPRDVARRVKTHALRYYQTNERHWRPFGHAAERGGNRDSQRNLFHGSSLRFAACPKGRQNACERKCAESG